MSKAVVFISHISEEREIAIAFRELVEVSFLGLIDVFVSSDAHSIQMGQKWLNNITAALKDCAVEIILCSPVSVKRPWINFEAGAGWILDIPVIPLCHSGVEPSALPLPLNLLQAAKAGDVAGLSLIFPVLAGAIGAKTPKVDFTDFVTKVKEFETKYTFWDSCNSAFARITDIAAGIVPYLLKNQIVQSDFTETQIGRLEDAIVFLQEHNILKIERLGIMTTMSGRGTVYGCRFIPLPMLPATVSNPHFRFK